MKNFIYIFLLTLLFSFPVEGFAKRTKLQVKASRLEKKLEKSPNNRKLQSDLGIIYYKMRQWDKALVQFKAANDPQKTATLNWIAKTLNKKKDYLEEIRALEILLQDKPKSPGHVTRLAVAYYNINNTDKAIEMYRRAIGFAPKYKKAYQGLLDIYSEKRNFYEMKVLLGQLIYIFGAEAQWLSRLCEVSYMGNYYEDAKNVCQRAITKNPKIPENHIFLGLSYKFTGGEAQARKIITSAAKKYRKSEFTQWSGGQINDEIKNWELSRKFYKQCTRVDKESSRCQLALAEAEFELKKYKSSLSSFHKACELEGTVDPILRKRVVQLRMKKSKWEKKFQKQLDGCSLARDRALKKIKKRGA